MAHRALVEADRQGTFADRVLNELYDQYEPGREDRALGTLLVQESLRRRGALDHQLDQLLDKPFVGLPVEVQDALRIGLVQLLHLDRVPAHAAVTESVSLVHGYDHPDLAPVVNAVLRRAARGEVPPLPEGDDPASLAARHSFPGWLARRWHARYGERTGALMEGSNRIPSLVLRVDEGRTSVDEVARALDGLGVAHSRSRLHGASLRVEGRLTLREFGPFLSGRVTVQDESESLVGVLVDPLPSHRVLDLCAAPGGKTSHLLELSKGMAEVVAVEPVAARMTQLRQTLERVGHRAHLVRADGQLPPFRREFDRVLVDAPCTGTGVLARRAEARWRLEPEHPPEQAALQPALLTEAADLVVVGGILVYSVCSIEPEETTEVVETFLRSHPEFEPVPVEGIPRDAVVDGNLFLLPGSFDADGVFAARFRRSG